MHHDYVVRQWLGPFKVGADGKISAESTDFIEDEASIRTDLHNPNRYKFVHPNFDCWHKNLNRVVYENNGMKLVVITSETTKGDYTKAFFNLSELEIDTFYTAQGGNVVDPVVAEIRASLPKQT